MVLKLMTVEEVESETMEQATRRKLSRIFENLSATQQGLSHLAMDDTETREVRKEAHFLCEQVEAIQDYMRDLLDRA